MALADLRWAQSEGAAAMSLTNDLILGGKRRERMSSSSSSFYWLVESAWPQRASSIRQMGVSPPPALISALVKLANALSQMTSSTVDTKAVMKKAFDHMKPGGWIEFHDPEMRNIANDNSAKGIAIEQWVETIVKGAKTVERGLRKPAHYQTWLSEIGFVNVHDAKFPLPINEWPENAKLKQVGTIYKHNLLGLIESLAKFLTLAGLSNTEAEDLKERVKRDIHDPQIRIAFPL